MTDNLHPAIKQHYSFLNVAHKDASITDWCQKITAQIGQPWRYLKVPQRDFDTTQAQTFAALVVELTAEESTLFGHNQT